jgi:putative tricarboxylic transport membrane protein
MKIGRETKIASGLIVFCLFNYFYLIPSQVINQGSVPTYPFIVNTLILVSSVGYFFQSMFQKIIKDRDGQKNKSLKTIQKPIWRAIVLIIFISIWVSVLDYVGFLLSTIILLIGSIILFGSRNYTKTIIISILFPIFVYFLFRGVLKTTLPEGFLENILERIIFD